MRFQASLPLEFWGEYGITAAYLISRTPLSGLKGRTHYEILFHDKPSYNHLHIFGSLCYMYNFQRPKDKFGARSRRCIFFGYPYGKKGWKVNDLETGEIFVSRDVIFHEGVYPFAGNKS